MIYLYMFVIRIKNKENTERKRELNKKRTK